MEMPKVEQCNVNECSYNDENRCHALAVTIGDGVHPHCDTYVHASHRGGDRNCDAGVGACKVEGCSNNKHLECHAKSVQIGWQGDEIDCLTYKRR